MAAYEETGRELTGNHLADTKIIMSGVGITEIDALYDPIERPAVEVLPKPDPDEGMVVFRGIPIVDVEEISDRESSTLESRVAKELLEMRGDEADDSPATPEEEPVDEIDVRAQEVVTWFGRTRADFARSIRQRRGDRVVRANRDDGLHVPRDGERGGVSAKEKSKDRWPQMPHRTTAKERREADRALQRHNRKRRAPKAKLA